MSAHLRRRMWFATEGCNSLPYIEASGPHRGSGAKGFPWTVVGVCIHTPQWATLLAGGAPTTPPFKSIQQLPQ